MRTEIGGYTLVRQIGAGGMSTVFEARDAVGKPVALKLIHPHIASEQGSRERLRREVRMLQRVGGSRVSRIIDAETDEDDVFIVTELIDGQTLERDVAEGGVYAGIALVELGDQLIEALDAIHAVGVLHRDLKPSNVMMGKDGPVLIDFGIAQLGDDSRYTRTGQLTHTPGYCDPRVIRGTSPDIEADWWAIVAVLAFAATGKHPFGGGPQPAIMNRVLTSEIDLSGVPTSVADAFRRALLPDEDDRLPMTDLLDELESLSDGDGWRDPISPTIRGAVGIVPAAAAGVPAVAAAVPAPATAVFDDATGQSAVENLGTASLPGEQSENGHTAIWNPDETEDPGATRAFDVDDYELASDLEVGTDGRTVAIDPLFDAAGNTIRADLAVDRTMPVNVGGTERLDVPPALLSDAGATARVPGPVPPTIADVDMAGFGGQRPPTYSPVPIDPRTGHPVYDAPARQTGFPPVSQPGSYDPRGNQQAFPAGGTRPVTQPLSVPGGNRQPGQPIQGSQPGAHQPGFDPLAPIGPEGYPSDHVPAWLRLPPTFRVFLVLAWVAISCFSVTAPYWFAIGFVAIVAVFDVIGTAQSDLMERRRRRGVRASNDSSFVVVRLPWTILKSLFKTAVSAVVGFGFAALLYWLIGQANYTNDLVRVPIVMAVATATTWLLGSSIRAREGARYILAAITPTTGYRIFWVLLAAAIAGVAVLVLMAATGVNWSPWGAPSAISLSF